jgi:hypothetical protein
MNTARKYIQLTITCAALSAFSATAIGHPGHVEQGKKSQKRSGMQAVNAEKTGELLRFTVHGDATYRLNP